MTYPASKNARSGRTVTTSTTSALARPLSTDDIKGRVADGALVVDVRDATEVEASGKVPGAVNVPRGMIEFRADLETQYPTRSFAETSR